MVEWSNMLDYYSDSNGVFVENNGYFRSKPTTVFVPTVVQCKTILNLKSSFHKVRFIFVIIFMFVNCQGPYKINALLCLCNYINFLFQ